ncbi:MAG: SDR family NAD(P)-dependent oxidoreductase [Flavobacteriales bacterium]|nr:SDR family NAD(P)-dependent oxidoreductase [Flavobacteriales bacterium]
MKQLFYITGTSRGIGQQLALQALAQGADVIGFARNNAIDHPNYKHITLDFSNLDAVKNYSFESLEADRIVLINNAGTLGEMKHVGNLDADQLIAAFNINLIAPSLLINSFIKTFGKQTSENIIFNISSGAANHPYDGWSAYCSTKAGLDMYAKVVNSEQAINANNVKIMSVAPGIIATKMQEQIRATDVEHFSLHQKFIEFHENGDLKSPEQSAKELLEVIKNATAYEEVVFDLRDV